MKSDQASITEQAKREPIAFAIPHIDEDDVQAVSDVLRTGWITTGPQCLAFEQELASYLDVAHVVACSAATTAQEIAVAHLGLPSGARVGVPDWTFVSTALAAHRSGLVPVLLDVDEDDLNLSPDSLEQALAEGLDAVVGVHFGGVAMSADIRELCNSAGVPFIEDAAHAFGAKDDRGYIAGQGTAGACFSFYATKNLSTGEGGALATDDADLAAFARTYRLHGMSADAINRYTRPGGHTYDVTQPGIKANLSDLQAALGRSQLARFDQMQARRREITLAYRSMLGSSDLRFVPGAHEPGSADHLLVIDLLDTGRSERVAKQLVEDCIGVSVHFRPLHTFSWFEQANIPIGPSGLPVTSALNGRILSLPLHPSLTDADLERITDAVLAAV